MKCIKDRKQISSKSDNYVFLDRMMDFNEDDDITTFSDALIIILGGFHTTGNGNDVGSSEEVLKVIFTL